MLENEITIHLEHLSDKWQKKKTLFDPLTLALSILIVFYLICLIFIKKNTETFDPLSIAYLFSNC